MSPTDKNTPDPDYSHSRPTVSPENHNSTHRARQAPHPSQPTRSSPRPHARIPREAVCHPPQNHCPHPSHSHSPNISRHSYYPPNSTSPCTASSCKASSKTQRVPPSPPRQILPPHSPATRDTPRHPEN